MFRCVLSEARSIPFPSYSRKVAWLRNVRDAAVEDCERSSVCPKFSRFSTLSRPCHSDRHKVTLVPSPEFIPSAVSPTFRTLRRGYCTKGEGESGKRKEEKGNNQAGGNSSDDGLDDEFRDLLKEISKDFDVEENAGEKDKQKPSEPGMSAAAGHTTSAPDPWNHVAFPDRPAPALQEPQLASTGVSEEVEDFSYYDEEVEDEVEPERVLPVELKRGERGVYDLEELMKVLASVNALEPCVIHIPPAKKYVEDMVIVSALSYRHMKAIAHEVTWIYKQKKRDADPFIKAEGLDTSREWFAMDMGNIALHIFMPEARQRYDLETLWTLGPENDPQCQEEDDPYTLTPADLLLMEVNRARLAQPRVDDQEERSSVTVTGRHDSDDEVRMGIDDRPRSSSKASRSSKKSSKWQ